MSAQQSNQQQRPPERWKPESTEWYYPVPPKVKPGVGTGAPSDAIILFDGKDLSMWESAGKDGGPAKWTVKDGAMIVASGTGSIRTKDYFGDCQLHIEFKTPTPGKDNTLQMKGNSGIMLQSRYEVQVLDCEDNPTYVNGWVGSIYKQSAPLVNAFTKTNEWQEVYKTQIESSMKKDCKNVIIFPQQIEGIAMSFIEGMLDAMKSQVLRRDFYKYFDIQGNEKVIKKFQDVIFMGDD